MKHALMTVLAVVMALTGCRQQSDEQRVEAALEDNPFFKSLGAVPADKGYKPGGGRALTDGDTSLPIGAWRNVHEPEINYEIAVQHPYAEIEFDIAWPCTLFVVYTDIPDTSIRDTVVKPAPEFNGDLSMEFEFDGEEWHLVELSPLDVMFDSAAGLMRIDSVQVQVRRNGQTIVYPTLAGTGRLPMDPYPYVFNAGDSIDLRLWETHAPGILFPWAYLHGPPNHNYGPFQYEQTEGYWYGSWVISPTTESEEGRWVWFEVIDINDALLNKHGPDRSVLWGVGYIVE